MKFTIICSLDAYMPVRVGVGLVTAFACLAL
jgi:hypothetical protein